jgi:hypothetical protein
MGEIQIKHCYQDKISEQKAKVFEYVGHKEL